jgi:hypothetical protein
MNRSLVGFAAILEKRLRLGLDAGFSEEGGGQVTDIR